MRRVARVVGWVVGIGLCVYLAVVAPQGRWRLVAFVEKMIGARPDVTWADSMTAILPQTVRVPLGLALAERSEAEGEEPCPIEWRTLAGTFWGRESDRWLIDYLIREHWVERIYEHPDAHVQPGDVVLDVGAHLGTFTRYALTRGAERVVAFEPEPVNARCFSRTFAREMEAGRVTLVEAAAWESEGELTFAESASDTGRGRVAGEGRVTVRAARIDDVVSELGLRRVDFVKMDIVGAERRALAGAVETIGKFAPRMAVSVSYLPDDPEVVPRVALGARGDYELARAFRHIFLY